MLDCKAWDKTNKKMLSLQEMRNYYGGEDAEYIVLCQLFDKDSTWETLLYIGIKDKNKKKIFVGDILQWPKSIMSQGQITKVEYICDNNGNGFFAVNKEVKWNIAKNCPAKIIGNIWENPELL